MGLFSFLKAAGAKLVWWNKAAETPAVPAAKVTPAANASMEALTRCRMIKTERLHAGFTSFRSWYQS
jgi:hypothetical protein